MASNLESHKQNILNKLREADSKGLSKSQLIASSRLKQKALIELEKSREIANLGNRNRTRYVLQEFNTPLEMACDIIEKKTASEKPALFSKTKFKALAKGAPTKVVQKIDEAVKWLLKEKKLLKLSMGKKFFFVNTASIQSLLSDVPGELQRPREEVSSELKREQVLAAYHKVAAQTGFSNVEIYELQQVLGASMDHVKAFILEESCQGKAVLSLGDWSLSSETTRSGAVEVQGKPYLLVRFKE